MAAGCTRPLALRFVLAGTAVRPPVGLAVCRTRRVPATPAAVPESPRRTRPASGAAASAIAPRRGALHAGPRLARSARLRDLQVADGEVRGPRSPGSSALRPATVFAQLAQQGISRDDIDESIREQLLVQRIAAAAGKADTSEAALRARYAQALPSLKTVQLGYINVPDQADRERRGRPAEGEARRLRRPWPPSTRASTRWPRLEADDPGQGARPAGRGRSPRPRPNTAFAVTVPGAAAASSSVSSAGSATPRSSSSAPPCEQAVLADSEAAGARLVTDFQKTLHVTVNPRFGVAAERQAGARHRRRRQAGQAAAATRHPERRGAVTGCVLVVTVSPRLPGLLNAAGWRALSAGRPLAALPGAAATAGAPARRGVGGHRPPTTRSAGCPRTPSSSPGSRSTRRRRTGADVVAGAPEPAGARAARRRRGHGPAALARRLPVGRRADARLAARLPARGGARGLRRDRRRRRRRACARSSATCCCRWCSTPGSPPRPRRTGGSTSTTSPATWSTSWSAGTRTCSATPGPRDVAAVEAGWEEIKQAEKQRRSPTEGVSRSQPAAVVGRRPGAARRPGRARPRPEPAELAAASPEELGERLLAVVDGGRAARLGRRGRPAGGGPPLRG